MISKLESYPSKRNAFGLVVVMHLLQAMKHDKSFALVYGTLPLGDTYNDFIIQARVLFLRAILISHLQAWTLLYLLRLHLPGLSLVNTRVLRRWNRSHGRPMLLVIGLLMLFGTYFRGPKMLLHGPPMLFHDSREKVFVLISFGVLEIYCNMFGV